MTYIFMDESGDAGFKFDKGSSRFFVIAAAIFDDDQEIERTSIAIKTLKRKLGFEDYREFKFHKLNRTIRVKFLKEINKFKFRVRHVAIDKSRLKEDNFKDDSFYAYAVKTLLESMSDNIFNIKMKLDGSYGRNYKRNFMSYLKSSLRSSRRNILDNFQFIDSKGNNLIQLADMIVGSLRKFYEEDGEDKKLYRDLIKNHLDSSAKN